MTHKVNANKDSIMNVINNNDNFCEIGKQVCKMHLQGYSNSEIAAIFNEDEDKVADTIRKMGKVVSL